MAKNLERECCILFASRCYSVSLSILCSCTGMKPGCQVKRPGFLLGTSQISVCGFTTYHLPFTTLLLGWGIFDTPLVADTLLPTRAMFCNLREVCASSLSQHVGQTPSCILFNVFLYCFTMMYSYVGLYCPYVTSFSHTFQHLGLLKKRAVQTLGIIYFH